MTETLPLSIRGLRLPPQIQAALEDGTWVLPSDREKIERVFTEPPTPEAELYAFDGMVFETDAWAQAPADQLLQYGGPGSDVGQYLALDPRFSVLIGDLGYDMPIALDYGISAEKPRVVYLPSRAPGWIEVAPDAATFMRRLGIGQDQ